MNKKKSYAQQNNEQSEETACGMDKISTIYLSGGGWKSRINKENFSTQKKI